MKDVIKNSEEYLKLKEEYKEYVKKSQDEINKIKSINGELEKYNEELVKYQIFAEENMNKMNERNNFLDKQLSAISNMLEISKYLNSNLDEDDLISKINDMLVGILGVTKSYIYLFQNNLIEIKQSKFEENKGFYGREVLLDMFDRVEPFVLNSEVGIFIDAESNTSLHSVIGVPITVGDKSIGYLILEHTHYDFFGNEHIKFISLAATQIGVSLENYFLYIKVKQSAITDPLLPVYTRRYFFEFVVDTVKDKINKGFAIVMIDLDNFKKCNDNFGHLFGDQVLIQVASIIKSNLEKGDILARYGGEELVIYIDDASVQENVIKKVENIRAKVEAHKVTFGEILSSVTASFGISYSTGDCVDVDKILDIADNMLYIAKKTGKNKVMSS